MKQPAIDRQQRLPLERSSGSREACSESLGDETAQFPHKVASLFTGIGGIEVGLRAAGHSISLLCESEPSACEVLGTHIGNHEIESDVRALDHFPKDTSLVAAGFPCQDLSQAGKTAGITGLRSSLVGDVFRLLETQRVPWVLLENVPFMLQLGKGKALEVVVDSLERLGYSWAYRVVDSRAFGLPQRRERVFILASIDGDPRAVLYADEADPPEGIDASGVACGFYWTEGLRGLGWANNAIPTLKGGSSVGIPSAPAVVRTTGEIVTPTIEDAEALQGFPRGWTEPAQSVARAGLRWRLVGNAVSVPVAEWIGQRLRNPGTPLPRNERPLPANGKWPRVAWNVDGTRMTSDLSAWPVSRPYTDLSALISIDAPFLSQRATRGFLNRAERSSLRFPTGFLDLVRAHEQRMRG